VGISTLTSLLHASLPDLSLKARAVIDALFLSGGSIGTAHDVASRLGLRNRFELARLLKAEGLLPLHDLAAWASVLDWVQHAEGTGCSLCQLAFRARKDPATCYRTVKRVTGLHWHELKVRGITEVLHRFLARCNPEAAFGRSSAAPGAPHQEAPEESAKSRGRAPVAHVAVPSWRKPGATSKGGAP